ncbi:MAG: carboxynorspermidine decarboxylase [Lentisphaerae bacterium]|nr:carboxynorspermidine decarboxylase [Lentisphaerota bacterium]
MNLDFRRVKTPAYVIDKAALERNGEILASVRERTGARVLVALKGFALFSVFPLLRRYLDGATASSLHEARLASEFGGEVHVCAPAYDPAQFPATVDLADHIVFNSLSQWRRFRDSVPGLLTRTKCGLRLNPEHSETENALYDACARYSRLGVTAAEMDMESIDGISGVHFHCLCEADAASLERILAAVEARFGALLERMEWLNLGGGHHIARDGYDIDLLCNMIARLTDRYGVKGYLEPGEAVALNAGFLVASVLDIVRNEMDTAVLDTSAAAHMPDVLEMPYRPGVEGSGLPGEHAHTVRLAGNTCLAGDVIGDYSFPRHLELGDKVVFTDMAHYTMVKNTAFNGIPLPSIVLADSRTGEMEIIREFGYEDYRGRLGPTRL